VGSETPEECAARQIDAYAADREPSALIGRPGEGPLHKFMSKLVQLIVALGTIPDSAKEVASHVCSVLDAQSTMIARPGAISPFDSWCVLASLTVLNRLFQLRSSAPPAVQAQAARLCSACLQRIVRGRIRSDEWTKIGLIAIEVAAKLAAPALGTALLQTLLSSDPLRQEMYLALAYGCRRNAAFRNAVVANVPITKLQ